LKATTIPSGFLPSVGAGVGVAKPVGCMEAWSWFCTLCRSFCMFEISSLIYSPNCLCSTVGKTAGGLLFISATSAFSDLNSSLRELISLDMREFEKQELDGN